MNGQPFLSLPKQEQLRTARHLNLPGFGPEEQQKLHDSKVLVVGAGGLGCPAMQSLVAAGVGTIVLYDDDTVDVTNLQRQILFSAADVGRPKVDVAAGQLRRLQPDITVETHMERLTAENILNALSEVDVVLDGSDNFATKFLVADAAEITGIPLIWATVLRYTGQLSVFRTDVAGLRDLFPEEPSGDSVPDCASAGVLGATTAVMGSLTATEAIKILAGIGEPLLGKILTYDALTAATRVYAVAADPKREPTRVLAKHPQKSSDVKPANGPTQTSGETENAEVDIVASENGTTDVRRTLLNLISHGQAMALDVREYHEKLLSDLPEVVSTGGSELLPMSELATAEGALDATSPRVEQLLESHRNSEAVVYCASGVRSQHFVDVFAPMAAEYGVMLYNLPGGVQG